MLQALLALNPIFFSEHYFHSKQSGTDADNYLLPLPYSSEEELRADQEAIYCKIDENK